MSDVITMVRRGLPGLSMALVLTFGVAACGGDAGGDVDAANAAETTDAQADAEMNPCAPAEAEAANPCAEMPQELPEGVTAEMVAEGMAIYSGAGICATCHGTDGSGVPSLGADLTDDEWLHSDGSYQGIVDGIMNGVTAQESSSGVPMPAKGGTTITDEQVQAVGAYVWTLSH